MYYGQPLESDEYDEGPSMNELKEKVESLRKTIARLMALHKAAGEGQLWILTIPENEQITQEEVDHVQAALPGQRLVVLPQNYALQNLDDDMLGKIGLQRASRADNYDRAMYDLMLTGRRRQ